MHWKVVGVFVLGALICQCLGEEVDEVHDFKRIHVDHGIVYRSVIAVGEAMSAPWISDIPVVGTASIAKQTRRSGRADWFVKMLYRSKWPKGWKTCEETMRWRSRTNFKSYEPVCGYPKKRFHDDKRFKSDIFD